MTVAEGFSTASVPDDAASLRRYWIVIGPFSGLIRRVALRLLDTDLR